MRWSRPDPLIWPFGSQAMWRETVAWRESFGVAGIMESFGPSAKQIYDPAPGAGAAASLGQSFG